jgi:hypothetical protein
MKLLLALCAIANVCCSVLGEPVRNKDCDYCQAQMELGIVLDSSSSISRDDFSIGQRFLQNYLTNFFIDPNGVRVSIITYGRTVHPEDSFNLTTYSTGTEVREAIGLIPHRATIYTATGSAIRFMREQQLSQRQVRSGIPRAALVITDGNSQKIKETAAEAKLARDDGIHMFAIGVGLNIDHIELFNIAGDEARVDRVDSYSKLETIIKWLVDLTCVGIKF